MPSYNFKPHSPHGITKARMSSQNHTPTKGVTRFMDEPRVERILKKKIICIVKRVCQDRLLSCFDLDKKNRLYLVKVEDDPGDVAGEEDDDDAEEDEGLAVVLVQLLCVRGCRGRTHHLKSIPPQFKINFFSVCKNAKSMINIQDYGPHYLLSWYLQF